MQQYNNEYAPQNQKQEEISPKKTNKNYANDFFIIDSDFEVEKQKKQVAQNIKTIRQINKLSQKNFGKLLGFSARTVSDWECSNTEPDIKTLRNMKRIFDVSYEDILD